MNTERALVLGKDNGEFFSSIIMISKEDNFKWEIVNVYGIVQIERKSDFIQKLHQMLNTA